MDNNSNRDFQDLFVAGFESLDLLPASSARVKRLRRLVRDAKTRSKERVFVVEGQKAVVAALASSLRVEQLFAGYSFHPKADSGANQGRPIGDDALSDVELYRVDDNVLTSVLDAVNPQLVAAVVSQPDWSVDHIEPAGHVVVAVEIRDPGNLGTILRTVEASSGAGLVIAGSSVDPFNPKVVRASAGSLLRVPILNVAELSDLAGLADQLARPVIASVVADPAVAGDSNQSAVSSYDRIDMSQAMILVGNEPRGLSREAIQMADSAVTIPTASSVESLNVAAATAVLCFEAARQARRQ